mgnify:CR=1 FL=1
MPSTRAPLHQQRRDVRPSGRRRRVQRRHLHRVRRRLVRIGARRQQHLDHLQMPEKARQAQRKEPVARHRRHLRRIGRNQLCHTRRATCRRRVKDVQRDTRRQYRFGRLRLPVVQRHEHRRRSVLVARAGKARVRRQ